MTDEEFVSQLALHVRMRPYLALIEDARPIRGVVVKVEKVKTVSAQGEELSGKCSITFRANNSKKDEDEVIETEWLNDPVALHIARVAQTAKKEGRAITLWKNNAPDPTGTVSQGFRRCVWIEA